MIKEKRINIGDDERSSGACCNTCVCALSQPPQCSCEDRFLGDERCESCEQCMCTRSDPPRCRCLDVKEFCHPPASLLQIIIMLRMSLLRTFVNLSQKTKPTCTVLIYAKCNARLVFCSLPQWLMLRLFKELKSIQLA